MAAKSEDKKMISSTELSKIIGKTDRHIQLLAKDGVITVEKRGTKNLYNLYTVVQEYIEYSKKSINKNFSSNEEQKLYEEIRLKNAKAEMAQLELDELRGNMHAAEDVEAMTTDLVLCVRSALMSMPGQLSVEVAEVDSAAEASEIIKKAVCDVLEELSRYEYNPAEYKKRVRERQGWLAHEQDDDDD
ncbi:MAG: protoporphyrinogen oxidase [bacterium]|nr:protoporphyrinogen oxidase [bacterium]